MIVLLLCVALALVIGVVVGYVVATARTPNLLAQMSDDELKALAAEVRTRKG